MANGGCCTHYRQLISLKKNNNIVHFIQIWRVQTVRQDNSIHELSLRLHHKRCGGPGRPWRCESQFAPTKTFMIACTDSVLHIDRCNHNKDWRICFRPFFSAHFASPLHILRTVYCIEFLIPSLTISSERRKLLCGSYSP